MVSSSLAHAWQFHSFIGVNPLQTTWLEHGIVSGRVALLLRSAEIQPAFGRFSDWTQNPITPTPNTQHHTQQRPSAARGRCRHLVVQVPKSSAGWPPPSSSLLRGQYQLLWPTWPTEARALLCVCRRPRAAQGAACPGLGTALEQRAATRGQAAHTLASAGTLTSRRRALLHMLQLHEAVGHMLGAPPASRRGVPAARAGGSVRVGPQVRSTHPAAACFRIKAPAAVCRACPSRGRVGSRRRPCARMPHRARLACKEITEMTRGRPTSEPHVMNRALCVTIGCIY